MSGFGDDLQACGGAVGGESSGDADGGVAAEVEGPGEVDVHSGAGAVVVVGGVAGGGGEDQIGHLKCRPQAVVVEFSDAGARVGAGGAQREPSGGGVAEVEFVMHPGTRWDEVSGGVLGDEGHFGVGLGEA